MAIDDHERDPYVDKLQPDASEANKPRPALAGFFDDSNRREGYRRLYLTASGKHYAEFKIEDVEDYGIIPEEQSPFLGEQATLITLRPDARVDYTRIRTTDDFDLRLCLRNVPANDPDAVMEARYPSPIHWFLRGNFTLGY
jgi:hypothetical protein